MKHFVLGTAFTVLVAALAGVAIFFSGAVYMGADMTPSKLEATLGMSMVDHWLESVQPSEKNPVSATPENLVAGIKLYKQNCAGCHGDKAHPESQFGLALYPSAPQFLKDEPDMEEGENFAVIKHGTRWTGMPAWKSMLNDQQIWTLTTFLSHMNKLPAEAQAEWQNVN